jgi:nucleoside-diphosphate-sugar epimerase
MSRALVTGGGGFIGSHVVDKLLEQDYEVRVLDSFATGRRENLAHAVEVEVVEGDIQSYERVSNAARDCEVVLHQAALPSVPRSIQDPLMTNAVNITGTLNVLLAARDHGVRRVVYASSSSIYGANPTLPKVETLKPAPISPYAVSKLAAESYCVAFHGAYGLECVALRYFNIFGPRQDPASQYSAVIPRFVDAALEGRRPVIFGNGERSRDFTFVENVVDANIRALDAPAAAGEVFNVACGERATLNDMLRNLGEWLDMEIDPEYWPARSGDVPHSLADISKARDLLGYEPHVSFNDGLRRTLEDAAASRERVQTGVR